MQPSVSVIIPVQNDRCYIRQCLEHVLRQAYNCHIEVLVVDGMSQDGTREIVEQLARQSTTPVVRLIDNPRGQRACALNIGIAHAKGDAIVRVDSRAVIPQDYISKCVETLIQQGADNVGGLVRPVGSTLVQRAIGLAMSHPFGVGNAQFRIGKKSGWVDTVYLGCFRKRVFDEVGFFDQDSSIISEDSDMNFRIRESGGKIYLNTDIEVYYYPREKLIDLWQLYFRYGGARAGFLLKHGRLTSWRQLAAPLFLLLILALVILSFVNAAFWVALLILLGAYLVADGVASALLAMRNAETSLFFPLLGSFPCMHISWALGFFTRLLERRSVAWPH